MNRKNTLKRLDRLILEMTRIAKTTRTPRERDYLTVAKNYLLDAKEVIGKRVEWPVADDDGFYARIGELTRERDMAFHDATARARVERRHPVKLLPNSETYVRKPLLKKRDERRGWERNLPPDNTTTETK